MSPWDPFTRPPVSSLQDLQSCMHTTTEHHAPAQQLIRQRFSVWHDPHRPSAPEPLAFNPSSRPIYNYVISETVRPVRPWCGGLSLLGLHVCLSPFGDNEMANSRRSVTLPWTGISQKGYLDWASWLGKCWDLSCAGDHVILGLGSGKECVLITFLWILAILWSINSRLDRTLALQTVGCGALCSSISQPTWQLFLPVPAQQMEGVNGCLLSLNVKLGEIHARLCRYNGGEHSYLKFMLWIHTDSQMSILHDAASFEKVHPFASGKESATWNFLWQLILFYWVFPSNYKEHLASQMKGHFLAFEISSYVCDLFGILYLSQTTLLRGFSDMCKTGSS